MKIIFIAGPFRGDGSIETKKANVEVARKFARLFIENNIPFYSPHLNIDQEMIYFPEEKDFLIPPDITITKQEYSFLHLQSPLF